MVRAGLWIPRKMRAPRIQQPRYRRACVGELIQIDGCDHRWFEERGPACMLLVYSDDATSQIMELLLVKTPTITLTGKKEPRLNGIALPCSTYDRLSEIDQGAVVDNKRLSRALEFTQLVQENGMIPTPGPCLPVMVLNAGAQRLPVMPHWSWRRIKSVRLKSSWFFEG